MALKITCPHCRAPRRLESPYPPPGTELQCLQCGHPLAISYPPGMVERLRTRGERFADEVPPPPRVQATVPRTAAAAPPADGPRPWSDEAEPPTTRMARAPADATVPMGRAPAAPPARPAPAPGSPAAPPPRAPAASAPPAPRAAPPSRSAAPPRPPVPPALVPQRRAASAPPPRRGVFGRMLRAAALIGALAVLAGGGALAFAFWSLSHGLPTIEALGKYEPPTVTTVYARDGRVLAEVYEKRRYVRPLSAFPQHLKDAFLAAEDAQFYNHDGVDIEGIFRAILRNAAKGRKAQGASTITMQVARNFLLTNQKTYERKIREVILAKRIEDAFEKDHILYLYLNEIYLGSGAYGIEAAARTYFGKSAEQLTLAESAIIAGLPQRPSDYSPHKHPEKARARQEYVIGQMLAKGYINDATAEAALAEPVKIYREENPFLTQAPHFAEHVRRYLVDTYGFDKIYNDGLAVHTTADLDLQTTAQRALEDGVGRADRLAGWRGPLRSVPVGELRQVLDAQESALRAEEAERVLTVGPPAVLGAAPLPAQSTLVVGRVYEASVLEVAPKHAIVGVGAHRALIPLSWTTWAVQPNAERSYKGRAQSSLEAVLKPGDIVKVRVEALRTSEVDNLAGYTAAGPGPFAAARLQQDSALQGALLSYRLEDGAVLAMVGGVDFADSEFNRVTQARRQVGSTFKPIVYAAAIGTRKVTAGTMLQDAPTAFATVGDKLWKPGNYGEDYLGNITLRRALQMSRNTCTVRVLDLVGLEPVFQLAGPALRIGFDTPACTRTHIQADAPCAGTAEPSAKAGMVWCTHCDANSCPVVRPDALTVRVDGEERPVQGTKACLDAPQEADGGRWCHSCGVNLRVCDWLPIERIPETDPCVDERKDAKGQVWCRSCDLSMGLGSSSLTMVELARAYSAFASYGRLVEPHWIDKVVDRDGTVIEQWAPPDGGWPQVMPAGVAGVTHFLLREVATGGTAAKTNKLGVPVAGKTGTTNDFHDAWFVGYSPKVLTAAWVGYDQPKPMPVGFTGGDIALPIWMDVMEKAAPRGEAGEFRAIPGVEMVPIDESTGRVAIGGRAVPMLPGTAPTNVVGEIGQKSTEDLLITDF